MLRVLSAIAFVGTSQAAYDPVTPIVPMSDYSKDTRSLDCWQCFDAGGFMCHDDTHQSQILATGSSNRAHGVCCKPGFSGEHCTSDGKHTCSQPSTSASDGFGAVLTQGKNHQMFAFCPSTGNQQSCGISDDSKNLDMTLTATKDIQVIKLAGDGSLAYNSGNSKTRKHDSCYYLIVADPTADPKYKYLNVMVQKVDQANVYLYGGKTKMDSKTSVVAENAALEAGKTYTFDASLGGFLVAYPNKDQSTHFEFNYWVGATPPVMEGDSMMMIIIIVIAVVVVLLIVGAVMKIRKNKENNQVTVLVNEEDNSNDKTNNDPTSQIELPKPEGETQK